MRRLSILSVISLLASLAAVAPARAEQREFCAARPGLGTPPCTLAPGETMIELGAVAWDHTADDAAVADTLTAADALVRIGLTERSELQLALGGNVHQRTRDRLTGEVASANGLGDATIAWKRGLAGPNGPVAVQAYVTLPVGSGPGTAGDWGAGVLLPVAVNLPAGFGLEVVPEVDAAVNSSGSGRHFAWGGVVGVGHDLAPGLSAALEISTFRDEDPAGHTTDARLATSLAWLVAPGLQLDAEYDAGLTSAAPDHTVALGLAIRLP